MDTRAKIVSAKQAAAQTADRNSTLLLSSFDVLTSARIHRVRALAQPDTLLIAVITELADSLLPLQARAELAAALAIIDLVIVADESVAALLTRFPGATVIDDNQDDARRTAELIEYVHQRNGKPAQ